MKNQKAFPLRIPERMKKRLAKEADREFRSSNGQILFRISGVIGWIKVGMSLDDACVGYRKDNSKPICFALRMPGAMYKKVKVLAKKEGISMNKTILRMVQ